MIHFTSEGTSFNLKKKAALKNWIKNVNAESGRKTGEISFVFCTDEGLLKINRQYLNHDTYTDIITFDYSKENHKQPVSGDIFISIDRVKENAEKYSKSFEDELHRVIIHGVLHLLGYKDKTKTAKEEMTKQEDKCLKLLKKINT
jgi:probable rRNA maturation factor